MSNNGRSKRKRQRMAGEVVRLPRNVRPARLTIWPVKVVADVRGKSPQAIGCLDNREGEIRIAAHLPVYVQHGILLHELIHAAETNLIQLGYRKRRLPERVVMQLASALFPILSCSGLWRPMSRQQAERSMVRSLRSKWGKSGPVPKPKP